MRYMQDLMARMVDVPLAHMFVLASILFLLVAVLGRIEGKIEPGNAGRIGATLLGVVLMFAGLAMHFNETEAWRDKMRESMNHPQSASVRRPVDAAGDNVVRLAMAGQAGVATMDKSANARPDDLKTVVKVVAGTYGGNCGAKPGNATLQVARICDGQVMCEFNIDPATLENFAPDCVKDFIAEWKCDGNEVIYTASVPAGARRGGHLRIACMAFQ